MRSKVLGRSLKVTLQSANTTYLIAAAGVTGTGPAALAHARSQPPSLHRLGSRVAGDADAGRQSTLVCLSARTSTEIGKPSWVIPDGVDEICAASAPFGCRHGSHDFVDVLTAAVPPGLAAGAARNGITHVCLRQKWESGWLITSSSRPCGRRFRRAHCSCRGP